MDHRQDRCHAQAGRAHHRARARTATQDLPALGIRDYRQAVFKPWRVVYRMIGERVVVYLIVDGRRDMQTALARRLLGA